MGTRRSLALFLLLGGAATCAGDTFDDLVANLKSPTARTRQEAARQLGESRRREAVAPLSALVRDEDPRVRLQMVQALAGLRDVSGIATLVTALEDGDRRVRDEAISAIVEIYTDRSRSGPVGRFLGLFSDEAPRASVPPFTDVDPSVFRGLSRALTDEDAGIRTDAAYAIGILGGGSSIPDLVKALQDPSADVRAAAAAAVGKTGTRAEGRALIPLLADTSASVRDRALQAIGVLRVPEAAPALRELFEQNRRRDLGTRALAALARAGDPAQADLLRELLSSSDPEHRRLAVEGLARVSEPSARREFEVGFQREGNADIRMAYAFGIARLGGRSFLDSLVLPLGGGGRRGERANELLLELGPGIAPDLYPYLNDADPGVRGAVAELLAALGDTEALSRLQPLLADPDSRVADRANRAIRRLSRDGAPRPAP
jgi:HEAT repeat protein